MEDIELVIKIPKEAYELLKNKGVDWLGAEHILNAVANGTPLPKGHGRLIDADELKKEYPHDMDWEYPVNTNCCVVESIDNSPTIIEADKAESDEV